MKKLMITMMLFAATMLCGNVANAQCQKKAASPPRFRKELQPYVMLAYKRRL